MSTVLLGNQGIVARILNTDSRIISNILSNNLEAPLFQWIRGRIQAILASGSAGDLYMTYALIGTKMGDNQAIRFDSDEGMPGFLKARDTDARQLSRLYLLMAVLEGDPDTFAPKVAQLIQVADTSELVTFLKFLYLLPRAHDYVGVATDALRSNIVAVFDAISRDNPYPGRYFNEAQWNQMYLKAAFMQRDLSQIQDVDERANAELARIISDYAHERWAASRTIDPQFWRPASGYVNHGLLKDLKRLMDSEDPLENRAAALCCSLSGNHEALALLEMRPELKDQVSCGSLTWGNLKNLK